MTINQMTFKQGQALARFITTLRPDWDTPGIEDALGRARGMAPADALAVAAIKAATTPSNRTPAVIGMEGPHWRSSEVAPVIPFDRGRVCNICNYPEPECRRRSERFETDEERHDFESVADARARRAATPTTPHPAITREYR